MTARLRCDVIDFACRPPIKRNHRWFLHQKIKRNIHHADLCGEADGKYSNHCFERLNFGVYMRHLLDSENGKWDGKLGQQRCIQTNRLCSRSSQWLLSAVWWLQISKLQDSIRFIWLKCCHRPSREPARTRTDCSKQRRTDGGFKPPPEIPKISVESSIAWARRTGVSISFCSSLCSHTVVIY